MFKALKNKAAVLSAIISLSPCVASMQPALASSPNNQSDVDSHKTSKDDNQHQVNQPKNSHKKGTPLPFEGPPANSKKANDKSAPTPSEDKKP
jgi:hypothetical protein